jgi:hypothetical protein
MTRWEWLRHGDVCTIQFSIATNTCLEVSAGAPSVIHCFMKVKTTPSDCQPNRRDHRPFRPRETISKSGYFNMKKASLEKTSLSLCGWSIVLAFVPSGPSALTAAAQRRCWIEQNAHLPLRNSSTNNTPPPPYTQLPDVAAVLAAIAKTMTMLLS